MACALSATSFEELGITIMGRRQRGSRETRLRRFVALFGIEPHLCAIVWRELIASGWTSFTRRPEPKHLLWTLLFLKCYPTEEFLATLVGAVDEKTTRKWVWFYVEGIASLATKFVSLAPLYFF
jgi:hypothetical protein